MQRKLTPFAVTALLTLLAATGCKVIKPPEAPEPQYLHYDTNQPQPKAGEEQVVDDALGKLQSSVDLHVLVVGHTDSVGQEEYNQQLSLKRAEGIRDRLVEAGIQPARIEYAARGESEPLEGEDTDEARAKNRRVELFYFYPSAGSAQKQYGFELVFGKKSE